MLVLTRNIGQAIIIDNEIVVRILNTNGNQIKIGVSAPDNISIHREEIWWRIQQESGKNNKFEMQNNYDSYLEESSEDDEEEDDGEHDEYHEDMILEDMEDNDD